MELAELPVPQPKANEAVVKLIAKELGISRSQVAIVSGHTSRHKRVSIPFDLSEARKRLGF